jgi:hypothetical protein
MRKIVVGAFMSLDGVMQAPGGPEEEVSPNGAMIASYARAGEVKPARSRWNSSRSPRSSAADT